MNNDNDYENIKTKVNYFSINTIPVHISKKNRKWLNGYIVKVTEDYLDIIDYEDGLEQVFLVDISDIEKFKPPILLDLEKEDKK